jgi:hypothetical protein
MAEVFLLREQFEQGGLDQLASLRQHSAYRNEELDIYFEEYT